VTEEAAAVWSGASYERIAETFAPIHDRVVAALEVREGERFLDLACGTGGVALRAARLGADVTGLDFSADQLAKARAAAEAEGLSIRLDEGDCEALPYADASFDVVASVFGLIFAPRHERVTNELARVTREGGRLAFTGWRLDEFARLAREVGREPPPSDAEHEWSREEYVREVLGRAFDLRFETGEWVVPGTPQALWEFFSSSAPPFHSWYVTLDEARQEQVRERYLEFFASGELRRAFLLTLGTRR
jgi:SAM-dependent methyltransferase